MQVYGRSVEAIPRIIGEASKSTLGLMALLIIVTSALAYFFFGAKLATKNARLILAIRLCAFLLVFSGACAFGWAVVQGMPLTATYTTPTQANEQGEEPSAARPSDKTTVLPRAAPLAVTRPLIPADYRSLLARAAVLAGGHNVPGNAAQACEAYARALHLVYPALSPSEQDLLRSNESECSQGMSEEHVVVLQRIARQLDARTTTPNQ